MGSTFPFTTTNIGELTQLQRQRQGKHQSKSDFPTFYSATILGPGHLVEN